jgi:hypothetical protein
VPTSRRTWFLDEFSGIAYGSHVFSQSDDYSGLYLSGPTLPLKYCKEVKLPVRVSRHSIVRAGSLILPGVELGEGSSIGAGSVVRKSTPAWSVCVGSPAKKIKDRRRDMLLREALDITYPGHVHDMGSVFWGRFIEVFRMKGTMLSSRLSLVETTFARAPARAFLAHALKAPAMLEQGLLGRNRPPRWSLVGGWEAVMRFE